MNGSSKADQIREMKNWSKNLSKTLIKKWPVEGTGLNVVDSPSKHALQLKTTIYDEVEGNSRSGPIKLYYWKDCKEGYYTAEGMRLKPINHRWVFIVTLNREILIGKDRHWHLSGGANVLFAGEVLFKKGKLLFWTNHSGHYKSQHMLASNVPGLLTPCKFAPIHKRELWVIKAALELSTKPRDIVDWTGWPLRDVEIALKRIKADQQDPISESHNLNWPPSYFTYPQENLTSHPISRSRRNSI